ncbi:succinate dehydrogenase [Pectinatus haikarae]|uniref:Succinate dehydrogenase / fumarate reductase cytochrome b subunit n=1 Tax=Pectinatus haikarae TaxID=349096 RepID=A0ABT9YB38_9FIRM|nr:succinate dehydrogenase [Pectinatus haikarae]MDQ0204432.1 succinate dehydrogenase / fumarate reductase cytochrome b subunit [Pectinatus haikarae]
MFHVTFYIRRLHSICGIVPMGLFLLEHVLTNAEALGGPAAFNEAIGKIALIPHDIMLVIEIFGLAIPFLFHMIYGLYIALQAKNNPSQYGYTRNWQFALQRWTAIFLFVFLIIHVVDLRIFTKGGGTPISYALLDQMFNNMGWFILYLAGMIAAIFHFCNGVTTLCMTWGIAKGPRIQTFIGRVMMLVCVLLSLVTIAFMAAYKMH